MTSRSLGQCDTGACTLHPPAWPGTLHHGLVAQYADPPRREIALLNGGDECQVRSGHCQVAAAAASAACGDCSSFSILASGPMLGVAVLVLWAMAAADGEQAGELVAGVGRRMEVVPGREIRVTVRGLRPRTTYEARVSHPATVCEVHAP